MRTHQNITNKLERSIVAGALFAFRYFKKENYSTNHFKWLCYTSSIKPGVVDLCYIDRENWKLDHIEYEIIKGRKQQTKIISLSPATL